MNLLTILPKNKAIPKIVVDTTLIIKADLKGIFILLVAQAKLATKASIDKAPTSKTAFTEDKRFMASVYPPCDKH